MKSLIPGHCNIRSGNVRAGADLHRLNVFVAEANGLSRALRHKGMRILEVTKGQTFCKMVMHLTGLAAISTWEVESLGFGVCILGSLTCSLLQT
jgi:hypothetical protein